jgi:hypothetical protein
MAHNILEIIILMAIVVYSHDVPFLGDEIIAHMTVVIWMSHLSKFR